MLALGTIPLGVPSPHAPAALAGQELGTAVVTARASGWTLDPRVYEEPGQFTGCPDGQRNAAESECLAAVLQATTALGLVLDGPVVKVVDAGADGWVPSGCSYSRGHGLRAIFNRNPAGRNWRSYPLVCLPSPASSSSAPEVLGIDNASWPLTSRQHLLIQHMPKTGGTSLRNMVFRDAARRGKTVQAHYGTDSHYRQKLWTPHFDAEHPAQVIMGHAVNFHMLQPVASGSSVRYVTMVRSPLAWTLSLYLHYHRKVETHLDDELVEYVQGLFTTCEGLVRGSNGTGCDGQLFSWYSGGAPAMPDKCESFVSFFTHSSHLLLLNERYEESIWLLYQMLGWGSPPALVHLNARPDAIYDQQVTLRTTSGIDAILAESCLPDIYAAARERFEHVYRLARAYCTNREPCDLATSQLGLSLWKPLQRQ